MQVFNVSGMTCSHCERAVTQAIQALDPQAQVQVQVDLAAGTVQVQSSASEQAIRQAISEEGYQVS
ncbi:MAG TPA: copper resistance protein CopZ [Pseudomonas sp.]|nr:copper resistance protein CopZ [Pseudomonas sp.]